MPGAPTLASSRVTMTGSKLGAIDVPLSGRPAEDGVPPLVVRHHAGPGVVRRGADPDVAERERGDEQAEDHGDRQADRPEDGETRDEGCAFGVQVRDQSDAQKLVHSLAPPVRDERKRRAAGVATTESEGN